MLLKNLSVNNLPRQADTLFKAEIPFLAGPIPIWLFEVLNFLLMLLFRLFTPGV